jgi:hypothetical protein
MKRYLAILVVLGASGLAFAQPLPHDSGFGWGPMHRAGWLFDAPYAKAEAAAIKSELGSKPLGELSLDQLTPYWNRMEVAAEKDRYLASTTFMSLGMPGAGQFRSGDALAGAGFLSLHLGVIAGTLTGFYFLLPADLRFDRMDYLHNSMASIGDTWRSHSIADFLPSMGIAVAGAIVDAGVRVWSARSAYEDAKSAIDTGKVHFEPIAVPGFLGMGMRF